PVRGTVRKRREEIQLARCEARLHSDNRRLWAPAVRTDAVRRDRADDPPSSVRTACRPMQPATLAAAVGHCLTCEGRSSASTRRLLLTAWGTTEAVSVFPATWHVASSINCSNMAKCSGPTWG